jgi:hypothetical protein
LQVGPFILYTSNYFSIKVNLSNNSYNLGAIAMPFVLGCNEITQTMLACLLTTFGEIFLEYSWNILEKSSKKYF